MNRQTESVCEFAPGDPRRHTYNAYRNYGCRCDGCRAAHTDYCREARHRRGGRSREQYLVESTKHGVRRYRKGCRCELCRAAIAAEKRRYRALHPGKVAAENAKRVQRERARRAAA